MALELTPELKARLMSYCHIDELSKDDENDLTRFYYGAVSYMENAGISTPEENTLRRAQYDNLVDALVLDKWDHRGSQIVGQELKDNPTFINEILQMEATEPEVSDSDTSGTGA